jgi:hypothetical protein
MDRRRHDGVSARGQPFHRGHVVGDVSGRQDGTHAARMDAHLTSLPRDDRRYRGMLALVLITGLLRRRSAPKALRSRWAIPGSTPR